MAPDKPRTPRRLSKRPSATSAPPDTDERLEWLARTSSWGDDELPTIQPWWRRQKKAPSRLDGTMLSQVIPLTDAQLIWLARCLQPEEKARLDCFWKEIVLDPLGPAIRSLGEIHERPGRLLKRRGRPRGHLGEDPLEIELSRLLIHRIRTLALEAVRSVPEPKRRYTARIGNHVNSGLVHLCLVNKGDLMDHYIDPVKIMAAQIRKGLPPPRIRSFDKAPAKTFEDLVTASVRAALDRDLRKDRSRAFWITLELWNQIGEPIEERSLHRILAKPAHLSPVPDLIRRPSA